MNKKNLTYGINIVSLLVLAMLMTFPFTMDKLNLSHTEEISVHLYPLTAFTSKIVQQNVNLFYINCFFLYLLPVAAVLILASFFYKKITPKMARMISFGAVTIYLSAAVSGMIVFANTVRWFQSLCFSTYVVFFVALVFHIFLITYKILSIKTENELYSEYKRLLDEEEKKEKDLRNQQIEWLKKRADALHEDAAQELNKKNRLEKHISNLKEKKRAGHIKTKIICVFLLTIATILSTFVYTDLKKSKVLFTQMINNSGKNQAEQVAASYYFSDGLHAKISAFFESIKKTNESSPFPCRRMDIITTNSKRSVYLEEVTDQTDFPSFDVFSYTTAAGRVHTIPVEERHITPAEAALYTAHFLNEKTRSLPIMKPENGTSLYVYPITFPRRKGQKLVGFSVVTYSTEILNRPYFQTKVFVLALSALFFYISVIITLFLADFIANPIIFLCGSIRKTANVLSEMLSGNAEVKADQLTFDENIATNDEVKKLSTEIGNIVSLVRGVLPYVSFHTLRSAEKNRSDRAISRDLCFLFTDIRGFTTLCEGLSPKEVIPILNHYLDIETKIIFDNGGDVDKYVGDEMMAFFSGPRKEIRACKAAMEIRHAMILEQKNAEKKGLPPISIGIGVNSGTVVFGSVGAKTRKDFTSIGDTVNLAARLEGTNKAYGSKSIISEAVYKELNDQFLCRELDYVTVKGKTEPVRIFEILQSTELSKEQLKDLKYLFEIGLFKYRRKEWTMSEKYFSQCVAKYNDEPSKVFLKRIEHYKISPPKLDWKGVFVMNVK